MSVRAAPELLEREGEIGALVSLLERGRAGSGGTLMIEGEPGVGKTALLRYGCRHAAAAGMTVLQARGGELEREFTWGVVRQLFEPWLAGLDPVCRSRVLAGSAGLAAPLFDTGANGAGAVDELFPTLHGLYWLTVNAAREVPVLRAIDDLHWCDEPTLRFAAHLASRLEEL